MKVSKTIKSRDQARIKANERRDIQMKLVRALLDALILRIVSKEPIHGYGIIVEIRKKFGTYFGPSTIYPLLKELESKGHLESNWDLNNDKPRKVYALTEEGSHVLSFSEDCIDHTLLILKNMEK